MSLIKIKNELIIFVSQYTFFVFFVVGFLLYLKSLIFDYTYLDDNALILERLKILTDFSNLPQLFQEGVFGSANESFYRPFLSLSFMIDALINSSDLFVFHITNILIHIINTYLLYKVSLQIKFKESTSIICSLFFLIHPILTMAVAWIPGRNDSLLTMFVLISFLFYIKYLQKQKILNLILTSIFWLFALLTKETSVFLPFILLLFNLYFKYKRNIKFYLKQILFLIPSFLIWFILRSSVVSSEFSFNILEIFNNFIKLFPALFVYMGKAFFPIYLSNYAVLQCSNSHLIIGILACVLLILSFFKLVKEKYHFLFFVSWFLIFLFPSFLANSDGHDLLILEHRLYLPIIGLIWLVVGIGENLNYEFIRKYIDIFLIFLFSLFFYLSFIRLDIFENKITFWENAVISCSQSSFAHKNYGAILYLDNNYNQSIEESQKSLKIYPEEPMANNNIGLAYFSLGKYELAEEYYLKELRYYDKYVLSMYNLALLYLKEGDYDKAQIWLEKSLEILPDYQSAQDLLNYINQSE